jgi:Protein of unknown function (Hypoth_ymh)
MYNLTEPQKDLLRSFVRDIREGRLPEEFYLFWDIEDRPYLHWAGSDGFASYEGITRGKVDALVAEKLIHCHIEYEVSHSKFGSSVREDRHERSRRISITGSGYKAVDSDFDAPDTSFVKHLIPLADVSQLDSDLRTRCLPILGAGPADPKLWDSAVRTAGVVLEERLRIVGQIRDHSVGRDLVNKVFGKGGTLAKEFDSDSERDGWRDLFAGVVGAFRNPSAHRLIDPNPHEGGPFIVFVNLLLTHLRKFSKSSATTAQDFLASCSPSTASFFRELFDEAQRRNLQVKFGSKGFTVRAAGQPCFFYSYPPGANGRPTAVIEIYLKDLAAIDPSRDSAMRVRLLQVAGTAATGDYTIRLPVSDDTLANARALWRATLDFY